MFHEISTLPPPCPQLSLVSRERLREGEGQGAAQGLMGTVGGVS